MSGTLNWDLPGCQLEVERDEFDATTIDTAESQLESRTSWGAAPIRYRWRFKIGVRTNLSGTNELVALRQLYETNKGKRGAFSMTDPVDGATIAYARFNSDLKMKRMLASSPHGAWWEVSFEVVSLASAQ